MKEREVAIGAELNDFTMLDIEEILQQKYQL